MSNVRRMLPNNVVKGKSISTFTDSYMKSREQIKFKADADLLQRMEINLPSKVAKNQLPTSTSSRRIPENIG